jgi:hypothetical protein
MPPYPNTLVNPCNAQLVPRTTTSAHMLATPMSSSSSTHPPSYMHSRIVAHVRNVSFCRGLFSVCSLRIQDQHTHTHTRARAHARTHTHTRTHARTHARTHGRTHTHLPTHPPILHFFSQGPGREGCHRRDAAPHESDEALRKTNATPLNG